MVVFISVGSSVYEGVIVSVVEEEVGFIFVVIEDIWGIVVEDGVYVDISVF